MEAERNILNYTKLSVASFEVADCDSQFRSIFEISHIFFSSKYTLRSAKFAPFPALSILVPIRLSTEASSGKHLANVVHRLAFIGFN